tara:strand:- start:2331 stop:3071 length:741 start_codon:yes stop_codon:yes gene_type:complete
MKEDLDQHFLINQEVLKRIIKESKLKKKDIVLEIGPGKGILTKELVKKSNVIAVEIDEDLKLELDNLELIHDNILEIIDDLEFNKIISNIPYSISEPLFKKMIKLDFELAILTVGTKFYEILTDEKSKWNLIGNIFFDIEKISDVSRDSFEPKPKTDSVILKFKKRKTKLSNFEKIIKEIVLQDDKKLKNALMYALVRVEGLTKKQAKEIIFDYKLPQSIFEKNVDYLSNKQFHLLTREINARAGN